MSVVIETTLGDLTVDLFTKERPVACMNFVKLCQLKYYNFNLFHTVQQGFIAQTGDPTGAGDGGSSVWGVIEGPHKRFFEAEYLPRIHHSGAGMLSLVSAGKNLVGSQFFFTLGEDLTSLDGAHCVIGEVVEGHEVLRKLNDAIVDDGFRPYQDIRITHTVVLEDPFPNPRGLEAPTRSPSPSAERLKNGRIAADEDIDDTDGKTMEEMQEMLAEREAKARATILEIVGDLPDAEMAPPENVLFVCKLNPVTTDDDLEIIFSRFGLIKGCEVIRDRKTGDSLQYAFVEFEDQKSCEAAYFKMDNVLIDDRRIHVDFSQSVSKVTWRGKGRGVEGADGKLDFDNLRDNDSGGRKQNNGRGRGQDDRRDRNMTDDPRSRMSSAERRKARELRHHEQEDRNYRKRSGSRNERDKNDRHGYKERDQRNQLPPRTRDRYDQRRSRSGDRVQRSKDHTNRRFADRTERRSGDRTEIRSRDQVERRSRDRTDRISRERTDRSRNQSQRSRDRTDRSKDRTERRPRDRMERTSRDRTDRSKDQTRSRDDPERRSSQSRDRNERRRERSPQDRRRNENGGHPSRETIKGRERSSERRSRDEQKLKTDSRRKSPERKRKLSASEEKKSKKQVQKKSKRAKSSSSDSSESSSESESESDTTSSDSSDSSSSSSSDQRRKSKKSKKKKAKSRSSHKSKKKHHRK